MLVGAGVNDLAGAGGRRRGPEELVAITERLCTRLDAEGIRTVVLTPIWADEARAAVEMGLHVAAADLLALREGLLAWGERERRDVVDLWPVLAGRGDLLSDGVHPTGAGHALLAAALAVS